MSIQDVHPPHLPVLEELAYTLPRLLGERAARTPERPFLHTREATWTYREAWLSAGGLEQFLREETEWSRSGRLATFLDNRPELVWACLAAPSGSGALVPLNRQHRGEILAELLARSAAEVLVTDAAALRELPPPGVGSLKTVVVVDGDDDRGEDEGPAGYRYLPLRLRPSEPDAPEAEPLSVAQLMFTSGSTGRSKAARLSHRQLCRGSAHLARSLRLDADDVFYGWLPLYHIAGQMHVVLASVIAGGSVALRAGFSVSQFWEEVREVGATITAGFPNILHWLLELPASEQDREHTLTRALVAKPSPELAHQFTERFGVALTDTYGMTEVEPITVDDEPALRPSGSCGLPAPDLDVALVDDEDEPVSAGQVGEICVRPRIPGVIFSGYEGDDATTVAAWRNLWFHTGDLARQDERGFITLLGRKRHAIRRSGENVSAEEVEAIVEGHPDVLECAAVGVASEDESEDVKIVVVPAAERTIDASALYEYCAASMARFMVPRYIEVRAELPRLAVGKVDRTTLRRVEETTWDARREKR